MRYSNRRVLNNNIVDLNTVDLENIKNQLIAHFESSNSGLLHTHQNKAFLDTLSDTTENVLTEQGVPFNIPLTISEW